MASIRQNAKGNWTAQIYLGRHPETGKVRFTSKTFKLQKEAESWAKRLETQREDGLVRASLTRVILASYVSDWLRLYATQVRDGTAYTAEKVLGKWIINPPPNVPFLGRIALRKLTVSDFDRFYLALSETGLQRRGIEQVHGLLKRALKSAVRKGDLPRNPAEFATLPKPDVKSVIASESDEAEVGPVKCLTKDQAQRFIEAARKDRLSALWHVLLDAGLRPGEAFALHWRHVDLEKAVVRVRGTLTRRRGSHRKKEDQGWVVTRPKTESSRGDVPLSDATVAELRRWKVQQAKERLRLGKEWKDRGFLFTTECGSPLGNNIGRIWDRVMREADGGKGDLGKWGEEPEKPRSGPTKQRSFTPRFGPYVLRHTCATLALLDGVDLLSVSRRLRHKNIGITATFYGHVRAEHTHAAAESFDRLASGARGS